MIDKSSWILIMLLVAVTIVGAGSFFYLSNQYNSNVDIYSGVIEELNESILQKEGKIAELENSLDSISETLNQTKTEKEDLKKEVRILNEKVETVKRAKGVVNPSYNILRDFVFSDRTDTRSYSFSNYDCTDFSNTFIKNFRNKGYYSFNVELEFEGSGHIIVGIMTTDKGLVMVEPQSDKIMIGELYAGLDYCEVVGWDCDEPWIILDVQHCYE